MTPTTRTHTAAQTGPLTLDVELTAGTIRVTVEDRDRAEVTVTTAHDAGPTADAVRNASITERAGRLTVRLPKPTSVTQTVRTSGRGVSVMQIGGNVYGTVIGAVFGNIADGTINVSGGDVTVSGGRVSISAAVTVDVRLPLGSSLAADTTSADVETSGELHAADVRTVSGDIDTDAIRLPRLASTSGDITIGRFTGRDIAKAHATVSTVSGDVRIHVVTTDSAVYARSVSGDIRITGERTSLDARTVSGRVTVR